MLEQQYLVAHGGGVSEFTEIYVFVHLISYNIVVINFYPSPSRDTDPCMTKFELNVVKHETAFRFKRAINIECFTQCLSIITWKDISSDEIL
mgnify:CR=1 FL=1